jgi:hypothetical protein
MMPDQASKQWYYTRDGATAGPVPEEELRKLLPTLAPETLFWNADLGAWKNAADAGLEVTPEPVKLSWRLAARKGAEEGSQWEATSGMKIGRSHDCEVSIADPLASRVHAQLEEKPDGWWVSDQQSSNGTTVNGTAITEPVKLAPGDVLGIGDAELVFEQREEGGPAGVEEPAKVEAAPVALKADDPFGFDEPPKASAPINEPDSFAAMFAEPQQPADLHCPRCQAINRPGSRFCKDCGLKMNG